MKNGLLKLLCALSFFLFVGLTSNYAQDYVSPGAAKVLVNDMIKDIAKSNTESQRDKLKVDLLELTFSNLTDGMEVTGAVKMAYRELVSTRKNVAELAESVSVEVLNELKK